MAAMHSRMVDLGIPIPSFALPNANPLLDVDRVSDEDLRDADVLVVIFTCNHCPYARHIEHALVELASSYDPADVAFVAVCSNDAERYPADSFDAMRQRAEDIGLPFPYLHDETQEVALRFDAACTPDIFVFGSDRSLAYRGRFDETRPGGQTAHGGDLKDAIDRLRKGRPAHPDQRPAIGCSIKWKS
ncbi:MAG: thioredoxin family protein [Bacteroidota bacterium]